MKCNKCGFEREEDFVFCPNCGCKAGENADTSAEITADTPAVESFTEKVHKMLNSSMFLCICILESVYTAFSFASKNIPLINILMTIFLWLVFSSAKKGFADYGKMRCISGTVFAGYVINWVVSGLLILLGLISSVAVSYLTTAPELTSSIEDFMNRQFGNYGRLVSSLLSLSAVLIAAVFLIAAAIIIIFNCIGIRSIHKFIQSLYKSLEAGAPALIKCKAASGWLMTFGIFAGISAFYSISSFTSFIASGSLSAMLIISSILIKKSFAEN